MPANPNERIPISQIYDAFDSASHDIYRNAMARSRDGVVRVQDLVTALGPLHPELGSVVGVDRRCSVENSNGSAGGTPLSNDPSLRNMLVVAFRIATRQTDEAQPVITPPILVAAVLSRLSPQQPRAVRLDASPGVSRFPDHVIRSLPEQNAPPTGRLPTTNDSQQEYDVGTNIDSLIEMWLRIQTSESEPEREVLTARIIGLYRELATAPKITVTYVPV